MSDITYVDVYTKKGNQLVGTSAADLYRKLTAINESKVSTTGGTITGNLVVDGKLTAGTLGMSSLSVTGNITSTDTIYGATVTGALGNFGTTTLATADIETETVGVSNMTTLNVNNVVVAKTITAPEFDGKVKWLNVTGKPNYLTREVADTIYATIGSSGEGGDIVSGGTISGNLLVTGTLTANNTLAIKANGATIFGTVTLKGATTIENTLTVSKGGASIEGTLTSSDKLTVSSNGAAITGTLSSTDKLTVSANGASITGATTVAGKLTVSTDGADITGATTITGDTSITGKFSASTSVDKSSVGITTNCSEGLIHLTAHGTSSSVRLSADDSIWISADDTIRVESKNGVYYDLIDAISSAAKTTDAGTETTVGGLKYVVTDTAPTSETAKADVFYFVTE